MKDSAGPDTGPVLSLFPYLILVNEVEDWDEGDVEYVRLNK